MSTATTKKNAAHDNWQKENTVNITLRLNRNTDADIIAAIEKKASKAGFIKACIRECLKRNP